MKALRYLGPNRLEVMDIPTPKPAANEVLLRVKACGICGSDVHGYLGLTGRRIPPMTMGHEFSGQVAEVGEAVTRLKPGNRVVPYPVDFCGTCEACRQKNYHLCANKRQFGVLTVDGAFAEYICVPEKLCFKIADSVSFDQASLMEPLAVAFHAVGRAGNLAGKNVLIVGVGTIGLLVLECCKLMSPAAIVVSDLSDSRLALAKEMGANHTVNPAKTDIREFVDSVTGGRGVDVAFEAVGAASAVKSAMDALAFGGLAVWIGNNKPIIDINMQQIVTRELNVSGSFLYSLEDFENVVTMINQGKIDVQKLLSLNIDLVQAPEYFKKLAEDPGDTIKVVINP